MYPTVKWILIVFLALAVFACADLMMFPGSKAASAIFDWTRTGLPSLVTPMLGSSSAG